MLRLTVGAQDADERRTRAGRCDPGWGRCRSPVRLVRPPPRSRRGRAWSARERPVELCPALAKALDPMPARRYSSAAALIEPLKAC